MQIGDEVPFEADEDEGRLTKQVLIMTIRIPISAASRDGEFTLPI